MRFCFCILTLILLFALTACPPGNPDAIIHYTELGACRQANFNGNQIDAGQKQAIVVFNVSLIDNTKVNTTWTYSPANFTVSPPSSPQSNLGGVTSTIPATQKVPLSGLPAFVGIMVSTNNADGSDAANTNYTLLYSQGSGPGTIGEKGNSGTSFPFVQNCNSLAGQ